MTFAKESRDLLIECCVEFITMLSSEANDIAEKDAKKTIACEHITKALQDLGFEDYIPELLRVAEQFRISQVVRTAAQRLRGIVVWQAGLWLTQHVTVEGEETIQNRAIRHDQRRAYRRARGAFPGCRREVSRDYVIRRCLGASQPVWTSGIEPIRCFS